MNTARAATVILALGTLAVPAPAARAQSAAQVAALAQLIPVQAGAAVDRDTVTVGDVVRLTVRVHAPAGATVNFPSAVDSLGAVQALEPPRVTSGSDSARAADRIAVYRVAAWDVGAQAIRLGEILVQTDDGERRVAVPLPGLFVKSVLPADSSQRVPRPPRAPFGARTVAPWWWWALAAAAASALVMGVLWWRSRRGRATAPAADPFIEAERSFDRVDGLGLVAAGEAGRHAVLMTDVLRRYLAARIGTASLAQTSGELLRAVRGAPTVPHDRLAELLATADGVKFAATVISAADARGLGADARAIVAHEHARAAELEAAAIARASAADAQKAAA